MANVWPTRYQPASVLVWWVGLKLCLLLRVSLEISNVSFGGQVHQSKSIWLGGQVAVPSAKACDGWGPRLCASYHLVLWRHE